MPAVARCSCTRQAARWCAAGGAAPGSQDDPPGKEGLAALTAAMVAEAGSKSRTYSEVLDGFLPDGHVLSGSCFKETTVFSGVVHRDNLAAFTPVATEMIAQPRFDPADFERLRNEATRLRDQVPARQ